MCSLTIQEDAFWLLAAIVEDVLPGFLELKISLLSLALSGELLLEFWLSEESDEELEESESDVKESELEDEDDMFSLLE